MNTLNFIRENLLSPKDIVITTHFKPDGDALGSALALFHWLKEKGHNVQVIVPSDFPYFLDWLPGREEVVIYDPENENMNRRIQQAEWLFCLDFNHLSRLMAMSQVISDAKGMKIMIDHHLEPSGFDDVRFWDSGAAATAQLVYKFIAEEMQDEQHINKDIATCLYTGIMTDTGSFRFRSTTSEVHRIIANLIDKNIENWQIHEHIYNSNSEKRLRFLGHVLLHRLEVLSEYNTAIMRIDKEDLKNFSIGTGDTEGLVNYALSLQGIHLAVLMIEREDRIKLSFRSIGTFPCNELSKTHFDGGGHLNAAGGHSNQTIEQVALKVKAILPQYKDLLTN